MSSCDDTCAKAIKSPGLETEVHVESSLHGLQVSSKSDGCCGIMTLTGEMDLSNTSLFQSHIDALTEDAAQHLLVDCEAWAFIDSTVIQVLERTRQAFDGNLALVNDQGLVRRLLEIVGLDWEYPKFNTVDEALEHFHNGQRYMRTRAEA